MAALEPTTATVLASAAAATGAAAFAGYKYAFGESHNGSSYPVTLSTKRLPEDQVKETTGSNDIKEALRLLVSQEATVSEPAPLFAASERTKQGVLLHILWTGAPAVVQDRSLGNYQAADMQLGNLWIGTHEPGTPEEVMLQTCVCHLQVAEADKSAFQAAFALKVDQIRAIPGVLHCGYSYKPCSAADESSSLLGQEGSIGQAEVRTARIYVFWQDNTVKEAGKMALWNLMMASDSNGSVGDSSMHMMQSGGLFACDSDRTYSPTVVYVPKKKPLIPSFW